MTHFVRYHVYDGIVRLHGRRVRGVDVHEPFRQDQDPCAAVAV